MAAASARVIQYVQIELHAIGAPAAEVYDIRCIELPGLPDSVYSTRDLYRACCYGVNLGSSSRDVLELHDEELNVILRGGESAQVGWEGAKSIFAECPREAQAGGHHMVRAVMMRFHKSCIPMLSGKDWLNTTVLSLLMVFDPATAY
jgi:hypothetical protein